MITYPFFLKLFGFWDLVSERNEIKSNQKIEIVIDGENIATKRINSNTSLYHKPKIRGFVNWSYTLLVFSIISWLGAYALIKAVVEQDPKYVTSNLFTYLFVTQYFTGWKYFAKTHFVDIIKDSGKNKNYVMIPFVLSMFISVVLVIVTTIFLVTGTSINIYSDLYDNHDGVWKGLIICLMILEKFYSYNIFFINTVAFTMILVIQSEKIVNFAAKLNTMVDNLEEFLISDVITDFLTIKGEYGKTVTNFNDMFSSLTVLGVLGAYFTSINHHNTEFVGALQYMNSGCFVIIECVYIYAVSKVKRSIGEINGVINSPKFATTYLGRIQMEELGNADITTHRDRNGRTNSMVIMDAIESLNERDSYIEKLTLRTMIKIHETTQMNDWLGLNSKLTQEWETFTLLGFVIDDTTLITRGLTMTAGYFMATNLKTEFGF